MHALSGHLSIVVILHNSLLARGIACKLMEFANIVHLSVVDSESTDVQQTIKAESLEVIILDSGDSVIGQKVSLKKLFEWAPEAKIICLDHSSDSADIFTSLEVQVASAEQLLHIIQPQGPNQ